MPESEIVKIDQMIRDVTTEHYPAAVVRVYSTQHESTYTTETLFICSLDV
jgi:hypothetical protein